MGFWSSLGKGIGKIAPIAGGIAGAPFTGGASLFAALAPTIGQTLGSVLSGAAGGMAEGRKDINLLNQRRHEAQLQHNIERALAGINLGKFQASEQQRGRKNLLLDALSAKRPEFGLSNVSERIQLPGHTSNFELPPDFFSQFSGGPINVEGVREAGSPQFQDAGFLEKLTGGAGLGLSIFNALGQRRPKTSSVNLPGNLFSDLPIFKPLPRGTYGGEGVYRPPVKHAAYGDKGYL
jgi:hypothetical protein